MTVDGERFDPEYGDVRKLLKNFSFMVYTGNRLGDLELMEEELSDLRQSGLLEQKAFLQARMVIQQEKQREGLHTE
nr:YqgQ family protein [Bacillota bacterium]